MKRDLDLNRLQLLRVEGEQPVPELDSYTQEQRVYHIALCIEAELVEGIVGSGMGEAGGIGTRDTYALVAQS